MNRKLFLVAAAVLVIAVLAGATALANADFTFVNGQSKAIELRYWDDQQTKGCGTLQPGEECEVVQVGGESHYCWQYADERGRNCDPVENGCPVSPGRIVVDNDDCRFDPNAD